MKMRNDIAVDRVVDLIRLRVVRDRVRHEGNLGKKNRCAARHRARTSRRDGL